MPRLALATIVALVVLAQGRLAFADEDYFSDGKKQLVFTEEGHRSQTERIVLYSLVGGAALTGAIGTYFGLDSRSLSDEVSASQFHTGEAWTHDRQQTYDDALSSRRIALATLGVSAGFVIGTIITYVITEPDEKVGYQDWQAGLVATPSDDGLVLSQGWAF